MGRFFLSPRASPCTLDIASSNLRTTICSSSTYYLQDNDVLLIGRSDLFEVGGAVEANKALFMKKVVMIIRLPISQRSLLLSFTSSINSMATSPGCNVAGSMKELLDPSPSFSRQDSGYSSTIILPNTEVY